MPFFFANPALVWMLPAILLPVIFHLFFRLKRQVHVFPSLMFFTRLNPRLSAKRKVHEWLILFLRCLFIALLLFALLRPLFGNGGGGAVARLILIDNSASMAGPVAPNTSKFSLAIQAAQQMVKMSQPGDSVSVRLMIPDSSVAVPSEFNPDSAALQDSLTKLKPTDGAALVGKSIRQALVALAAERQPVHELHILTDLQRRNWGTGELEAEPAFLQTQIVVHRISSPTPTGGWVSLEADRSTSSAIPLGRTTAVRLTLHNYGTANGSVRLNTTDDAGKSTSHDLVVAGGAGMPVYASFSFSQLGFHWSRIWLEGDAAQGASEATFGFWIKPAQKAYLLGDRERYGALAFAISPGGNADLSGIDAQPLTADQLSNGLGEKPLCVATTYEDWLPGSSEIGALDNYVRSGGTVIVVPSGDSAKSSASAAVTSLDLSVGTLTNAATPESMIILQPGDPIWRDLRDGDGKPNLGVLKAYRYRALKPGTNWQPLLTSSNGATLLARRPMGRGNVLASGLAFLPGWSSLPLKPSFIVLLQNAILGDSAEVVPVQILEAGEELVLADSTTQLSVHSLVGNSTNWEGAPHDFPGWPWAGVAELKQGDKTSWVAVQAVADEAKPDYLTQNSVPLLKQLPHRVAALAEPKDAQIVVPSTSAAHSTLYRWLLALALVVLLLETWVANERRSATQKSFLESLKPLFAPANKTTSLVSK